MKKHLYKKLPRFTVVVIALLISFFMHTGAGSEGHLPREAKADYILVEKSLKRLTLYAANRAIKTYAVALGRNPSGPKLVQGDKKTPEGRYRIDSRNRDSKYHRSLHISYPNEIDRELSSAAGITPGGDIMIHGTGDEYAWMGRFHTVKDWTDGCIAVTNEEIEEIWEYVSEGTVIEIQP